MEYQREEEGGGGGNSGEKRLSFVLGRDCSEGGRPSVIGRLSVIDSARRWIRSQSVRNRQSGERSRPSGLIPWNLLHR